MSEWKNISATEMRLDVGNSTAYLNRMPFPPYNWTLSFKGKGAEIPKGSVDSVKWKATVEVSNFCNREIANYMKIRDHLPNLTTLAEKAGIFDEMD